MKHREVASLVDVLRSRAELHPGGGYTFLPTGEEEGSRLSWADLDRRARIIAAHLRNRVRAGERALLAFPSGPEFIVGFFGCLYAAVVAVPTLLPGRRRGAERFTRLAEDAGPGVVLTEASARDRVQRLLPPAPGRQIPCLATDALDAGALDAWRIPDIGADTLAFIQYTSGSTTSPRGVMITHGNLLHNEEMIRDAFRQDGESVVVGWLPVHHDMGLVGNVLQPLFSGSSCILMPPEAFLRRPARWLSAITRHRATTSGGPDFAYDLCVRRITPEERRSFDLSSWQVAFNGAEPVRHDTLERFAAAFSDCGFRREAFRPCYGLAEATLLVSAAGGRGGTVLADAKALEQGRFAPASGDEGSCRALESCGPPAGGQRVLAVDPRSRKELPDEQVGEIWIAGASVATGYWNRPGETAETFHAAPEGHAGRRWLRTGDLGFTSRGEIYITGRRKDLIIVRGRNLYPQDIEWTAEQSHPLLRPGGAAAFQVEIEGTEQLAVVAEVERRAAGDVHDAIISAVRQRVADEHGVHAAVVVLLPPGRLPRTTSGKVRRRACADALRHGSLEALKESFAGPLGSGDRPSLTAADLSDLPAEERRDMLREHLRELVAHLAGREARAVAADRPFHHLGLDSLGAMELRAALEADLGLDLPIEELLGEQTLDALAGRLASPAEASTFGTEMPQQPTGHRRPETEPLSHGQRSLWFLHRLQPESSAYNVAFAAHLAPQLEVEALRGAFSDLLARHDVLASVIEDRAGEPVRRILSRPPAPVVEVEAGEWPEERLQEEMEAAARRGFDLASEIPLRLHLYMRRDEDVLALLVIHHVAIDFLSLVVMLEELGALYTARRAGSPAALPVPAARYGDFARWQREMLGTGKGEHLWRRWKERLGGELPRLELPCDRRRPPVQGWRARSVPFSLPAATFRKLKALALERGTTPYASLLASFSALLRRYGDQDDLIVGTPVSGRTKAAFAEVVGYVSNLVPLRIDASGDPTYVELLDRVRGVINEALQLQDFPFPLLVERLQAHRDPGRHPIVQAVLALEKPHRPGLEAIAGFVLGEEGAEADLGDLHLRSARLAAQSTPFDLTVLMVEEEGGLRGSWRCNADLFDEETARRMAGHFVRLAEEAARRPETPVSTLPLLGERERSLVVGEWNDTADPYPGNSSIHGLFTEQARQRPEAVAVVAGTTRLTYGELDRLSNRVARRLRARGAGPEAPVGVALSRSAHVPAALLGILKAGGAYVPLDPADPPERNGRMIAGAGIRTVITEEAVAGSLPFPSGKLLLIQEALEETAADHPPGSTVQVRPEGLAYIMYTSGSTGDPKGVMVPHRAVVRLVRNSRYARFGPEEVFLHAAPLAFDASTFEIWGALLNGGRLVIHGAHPTSLSRLGETIAEHGVTTLWLTAGLFHLMVDERLDDLRPLRQLLAGGDVLSPAHVARAQAGLPGVRLINGYGPTEATTFSCCHDMVDPAAGAEPVPIGRPIANTRVYVVGKTFEPVPVGVPGELCIGGDGLARGYLDSPAFTAERFVPDHFSGEPGLRLYRTGDLVRWRLDGSLEFMGRLDDQVKVRGFRVEPGEVEAALASHPAVGAAAVLALPDGTGKRLVAYVAGVDGQAPPAAVELAAHLTARLPHYLVPSEFVGLDALPLNANGKVDRSALPSPRAPDEGPARPVQGVTGEIAGIWADVLGVRAVDIDRNLFEIGAHSLAVAKAHARIEERLGRRIPVVDLFAHPTVRALANHLGGGTGGSARAEARERAVARRSARAGRRNAENRRGVMPRQVTDA